MDSIPAPALPIVVATDAQPARDVRADEAADFSTFEQALEKEISLISPEAAQPAADAALAALVSSDTALPSDSTRIVELMLDSSAMLSSSAPAVATPVLDTVQPRAEVRVDAAAEAASKASGIARASEQVRVEARVDLATANVASTPAMTLAHVPAGEGTPMPEIANAPGTVPDTVREAQQRLLSATQSPAQSRAVAAAVAAPVRSSDRPLEPMQTPGSAARAPTSTAEVLGPLEKALTPPAASNRPGVQGAHSSTGREDSRARFVTDELPMPKVELRSERIGSDATASPITAPDSTMQPREAPAPLDALSSATLMPRSMPAPHHVANGASATPAVVRVDTPLAAQGWSEAFRQQIVWLVDRQLETAELHVNPPHLGPVEVVLKVSDDGARIAFYSPHAAVREAIEASLADLRSGLAERGLALGEALVSADPGSAREQMMREQNVRGAPRATEVTQPGAERDAPAPQIGRGLVDTFA